MNILPIPPLDGGKVALEIIEADRTPPAVAQALHRALARGDALLVTLIGYLMYADVVRFIVNG